MGGQNSPSCNGTVNQTCVGPICWSTCQSIPAGTPTQAGNSLQGNNPAGVTGLNPSQIAGNNNACDLSIGLIPVIGLPLCFAKTELSTYSNLFSTGWL